MQRRGPRRRWRVRHHLSSLAFGFGYYTYLKEKEAGNTAARRNCPREMRGPGGVGWPRLRHGEPQPGTEPAPAGHRDGLRPAVGDKVMGSGREVGVHSGLSSVP